MYQAFSNFILRVPLNSLDKINDINLGDLDESFMEGLFLSSRNLWEQIQTANSAYELKKTNKLRNSIFKYWCRSSSRCTPYGTFAGVAIGEITDCTDIKVSKSSNHRRHLRFDMEMLDVLIRKIENIPELKTQLKYYPNNSLTTLPNSFRYVAHTIINDYKHYNIVTVDKQDYIATILNFSTIGSTIKDLADLLTTIYKVNREQATDFVYKLIDSQILISDLEPAITGIDPFEILAQKVKRLVKNESLSLFISELQDCFHKPILGISNYLEIEDCLKKYIDVDDLPKNLFQTDLYLSTSSLQIEKKIVDGIISQASDLLYISSPHYNDDLETFKVKFAEKFDRAEVPLSVALDNDLGIEYAVQSYESSGGSEIIDDLTIQAPYADTVFTFDYIQHFALAKYHDYVKNHKQFIEITYEELKKFKTKTSNLVFPNNMHLVGSLFSNKLRIDSSNFLFHIKNFSGPSSAALISRFSHGDKKIYNFSQELTADEIQCTDVIYAEVVHSPQSRITNLLLRPVLYNYEITYINKSGATLDAQIPVSDLMVSVQNNQILLRSAKHNKQVIPRRTNAHNHFLGNLPVYKFLCSLQMEGLSLPKIWDWGSLISLRHLPRVIYKNLILKRARWEIISEDIFDLPSQESDYINYFEAFCKKFELPKEVLIIEDDNELYINFSQEYSIAIFLEFVQKKTRVILEEFLFNKDNCIVRDISDAPYTNEIVIPIRKEKTQNLAVNFSEIGQVKRKFGPNSEWRSFNIYCGYKTADQMITRICSFIENCISSELIEKFFFVRYTDGFPHLRIRFYNTNINKLTTVQTNFLAFLQPWVDSLLIHKITIDTYIRELERYSEDLIEEAESLFYFDSIAVMKLLASRKNENQNDRLLIALQEIDMLLNDFKFGLQEKHTLIRKILDGFYTEFNLNTELQQQLNKKYRERKKLIFSVMELEPNLDDLENIKLFSERSRNNSLVVRNILEKMDSAQKSISPDFVLSIIHMSMNRLFVAQNKKYELVVYHFLEKFYKSKIAIDNNINN